MTNRSEVQGFLPVKVNVPLAEYRRLFAEAQERHLTVAELIMSRAALPKVGGFRPGSGRKSRYQPAVGRLIADARDRGMSWKKAAAKAGVSMDTARRWFERYVREQRESARRTAA